MTGLGLKGVRNKLSWSMKEIKDKIMSGPDAYFLISLRYENGEQEHCLELWNRDGKGLRWNDTPCSFETFFVCEV